MLLPALIVVAALQAQQDTKPDPVCSADIRWAVTGEQSTGRAPSDLRTLTVFSAVSQPLCQPAEIRLTVAYFDAADELVCSGVVAAVATQTMATQVTSLELHLTNLSEWVRWRSGPQPATVRVRPLVCADPEGTGSVAQNTLERAASLRLYATVLTPNRGMATAELRLVIRPSQGSQQP